MLSGCGVVVAQEPSKLLGPVRTWSAAQFFCQKIIFFPLTGKAAGGCAVLGGMRVIPVLIICLCSGLFSLASGVAMGDADSLRHSRSAFADGRYLEAFSLAKRLMMLVQTRLPPRW